MSDKFTCNLCKKDYASQQSLCNHTRNIHNVYKYTKKVTSCYPSVHKKGNILHFLPERISPNLCTYCNKEYASRHSKSRHLKICKVKQYVDTNKQTTDNGTSPPTIPQTTTDEPNTVNHSDTLNHSDKSTVHAIIP